MVGDFIVSWLSLFIPFLINITLSFKSSISVILSLILASRSCSFQLSCQKNTFSFNNQRNLTLEHRKQQFFRLSVHFLHLKLCLESSHTISSRMQQEQRQNKREKVVVLIEDIIILFPLFFAYRNYWLPGVLWNTNFQRKT